MKKSVQYTTATLNIFIDISGILRIIEYCFSITTPDCKRREDNIMPSRSPLQYEKDHKMQQTLNCLNNREKNKTEIKNLLFHAFLLNGNITKKKICPTSKILFTKYRFIFKNQLALKLYIFATET